MIRADKTHPFKKKINVFLPFQFELPAIQRYHNNNKKVKYLPTNLY